MIKTMVSLTPEERNALLELAEHKLRSPGDQIRAILISVLACQEYISSLTVDRSIPNGIRVGQSYSKNLVGERKAYKPLEMANEK